MTIHWKKTLLVTYQIFLIMIPLIWTSNTSELFEFPKMLITYAFAVIIGGLWIGRMISQRQMIFRHTYLELPLLLFLLSQCLSTLFSIDPHTSLFGYYSRFNGGLFSLFSYILLYFAAVSNFDDGDAKKLIKTLVVTAVLSGLYAFPEHFGHSPSCLLISGQFHAKCWVQDVQYRVFGTFGQPNWLAAYLATILPLTLFAIQNTKKVSSRLIYCLLSLLSLSTILFTKSQSGLGATAIVLCLSLIFMAIQTQKQKWLLAFLPLALVISILKPQAVEKTLHSLQYINPFYSSSAAIVAKDNLVNFAGTDSMIIRRIVWSGAWKLALMHPFFGTGVETFGYSYYGVRPVEHNLISEWDFLYNKAHNEFLNFAANSGFIGLFTYLYFLGSFIAWSLKKGHRKDLLAGFVGLCVSNFFGFATVPVNILLFLIPALSLLLTTKDQSLGTKHQGLNVGHIIPALLVLYLLSQVLSLYSADVSYAKGKSSRAAKDYQTAISSLQDAVKTRPGEPLYTDELSLTASEIASSLIAAGKVNEASQAATIAIELSNRTFNLNPVHLNFYKTRAKVFINLTAVNPQYVTEAIATLDAAIKLAPTDAKLWFNSALLADQLNQKDRADTLYRQALKLKPNYGLAQQKYTEFLAKQK